MKNRKLLMIPGPIEFTPEVLRAMGMATASHVAPNFIEVFGQALERLRQVFLCDCEAGSEQTTHGGENHDSFHVILLGSEFEIDSRFSFRGCQGLA